MDIFNATLITLVTDNNSFCSLKLLFKLLYWIKSYQKIISAIEQAIHEDFAIPSLKVMVISDFDIS